MNICVPNDVIVNNVESGASTAQCLAVTVATDILKPENSRPNRAIIEVPNRITVADFLFICGIPTPIDEIAKGTRNILTFRDIFRVTI